VGQEFEPLLEDIYSHLKTKTMEYTKENTIVNASKKGRRRVGSSVFMGDKFLGLKYLCYFNNRHWYV